MSWTRTQEQRLKTITDIYYTHSSGDYKLKICTYQSDEEPVPHAIHIDYVEVSPYVLYMQYQKTGLLYVQNATNSGSYFRFSSNNPGEFKKIKKVIDIFINHHNLVGSEMHADLYSVCALGNSIEVMNLKLLELANANNINGAINAAIAYQDKEFCFDPILFLAEELYKKSKSVLADDKIVKIVYNLFGAISDKSPHYELAQKRMLEIICYQADSNDPILLLEEKFTRALNSKEQRLADRFFDELCGNPLRAEPAISNIHVDMSILLKLAAQIRLINESNKLLLEKNSELTKKVDKQKVKLNMWKSAPHDHTSNTQDNSSICESMQTLTL
jgi:hypothetical protein